MAKRYAHTSSDAYASLGSAGATLRAIAYRLIHEAGPCGMTALEVVDASGHDRWGMQPRISELVTAKAVVDSGRTRTNPSGREAIVWVIPEHGPMQEAIPVGVAVERVMSALAAKVETQAASEKGPQT